MTGTQPYLATGYRAATSTDADRVAAENWLSKIFGKPISAILPSGLAHDPGLVRGSELWALGWWLDARAEFDALHDAHRDDPASLFQLTIYYQGIGVYRSSLLAAARTIALAKQPMANVPVYLARLSYPINYADVMIPATQSYKIDPLYFASLIRLESDFDARANSASDARGLTQIVPTTAADIVGRLGWPPNFTNDDLYRPFISLRLGAYYVDFVRRYLGGNLAATLAGYNAGPGAASGWLNTAGDDLDLLYETITSSQAQDYVQYTYENDAVYRSLYGK
jgi:soluble lytic murein transglycosylase